MNLKELIELYRAQTMDADEQSPFCDDKLLTLYANEAQVEACRRGQLLVTTSRVTLAANIEQLELDPCALKITRAFINRDPVSVISVQQMDAMHPGWQFDSPQAQTTHLVTGVETGVVFLWPCPHTQAELVMTVQALPHKQLCNKQDKPLIRVEAHAALVDWMQYRAYSRDDTDLMNDGKAMLALRRFEAEFGEKVSIRNEEWMRSGSAMTPGPIA